MSDAELRDLERRAAQGDLDARGLFYAARIRACPHNGGTFLASQTDSLWGPGAQWCLLCGFCVSKPELEPRPESADQAREFDDMVEQATKDGHRTIEITEEDIEEVRRRLEPQLRPFRRGLTRWG